MDNPKCSVPFCKNTSGGGVPFPKQTDLKEKWLEALQITNNLLGEDSFVCLEHFSETDILDPSSLDSTNRLKEDAIPCRFNKETSEETEPSTDEKMDTTTEDPTRKESRTIEQILEEKTSETFEDILREKVNETIEDFLVETNETISDVLEKEQQTINIENETILANINIPEEPQLQQQQQEEEESSPTIIIQSNVLVDLKDQEFQETQHLIEEQPTQSEVSILYEKVLNEAISEEVVVEEQQQHQLEENYNEKVDEFEAPQQIEEETTVTIEEQQVENVDINNSELLDSTPENTSELDKICRLCMKNENVDRCLTDNLEDHVTIKNAINECLYPLIVSEEDDYPQEICDNCFASLSSCYTFRKTCFEINNKLQQQSPSQSKKRRYSSDEEVFIKKKIKSSDTIIDDTTNKNESVPTSPPPLVLLNNKLGQVTVRPVPKSNNNSRRDSGSSGLPSSTIKKAEVDKKFNKVEAELRKVLEGKLSKKDLMMADNIIISVESDEDESTNADFQQVKPTAVKSKYNVTRLSLPLKTNAPQIITDKPTKKVAIKEKIVPQKIIAASTQSSVTKGIRINKFEFTTGWFPCQIISGIYESEFLLADGYLFEYRLSKENIRFVRCVVPTCPSVGYQRQLGNDRYEKKINVQVAHNHETPKPSERKKQMFYYVMKRKMQGDKTLNFRSVYDEVCQIDPEIKLLVPLRSVINEICRHQLTYKLPSIRTFDEFYNKIEGDSFQKLHFTHNGKQFYQEKLIGDDGSQAIVFGSQEVIERMASSKLMYVDASFKIETCEPFSYQLVTVLVWVEDSYYPIMFALVSRKTQEIFRQLFTYLHDILAPNLRPEEIVTDYDATLYYALGETYIGSHIGGSCFYYTQNLYKKVCTLNLSRDLETNSFFRNLYHMLLMLPLLPVNTIVDGLNNIENQTDALGIQTLALPLFEHVRNEWINKVSPELFCVHRLENRINENVIAPFKKLRDFLMLTKGKIQKQPSTIINVVEKLIELEAFLRTTYSNSNKKSFARDLSSSQKKNVIRAWQYIENHPKININNFFTKVLGYIKCMENQLWIWGFYRYSGETNDELINSINFTLVNMIENENENEDDKFVEEDNNSESGEDMIVNNGEEVDIKMQYFSEEDEEECADDPETVVVEAVIDENGSFILANTLQKNKNIMVDEGEEEHLISDSEVIEHNLSEHDHHLESGIVIEDEEQHTVDEEGNNFSKDSMNEQIIDSNPLEAIQTEGTTHFEHAFLKYVYK